MPSSTSWPRTRESCTKPGSSRSIDRRATMQGKRLIRTLGLRNLLSFGEEMETVDLQPLNVLIGPNAAGKSNLIEAIGLLRATPKDLAGAIREGGGIGEWLWKGDQGAPSAE